VSSVKYELGFYIPEDAIPYTRRRGNLRSYILIFVVVVPAVTRATALLFISSLLR
jgi:hypothetical protein